MFNTFYNFLLGAGTAQNTTNTGPEPKTETCLICQAVISPTDDSFQCPNISCKMLTHASCMAWENLCPLLRTHMHDLEQAVQRHTPDPELAASDTPFAEQRVLDSETEPQRQAPSQAEREEQKRTDSRTIIFQHIYLRDPRHEAELHEWCSTFGLVAKFVTDHLLSARCVFESETAARRACRDLDGMPFHRGMLMVGHAGTWEDVVVDF